MTSGRADSSSSGQPPFALYSEVYDLLYYDKDYGAEAAFVASLIRRFAQPQGGEYGVADLACGTGRHAIELAKMGYRVVGSDISEGMVGVARAAAAKQRVDVEFFCEPFQTCSRIGNGFDVALAMFSSLGYLQSRQDLDAALAEVRAVVGPGGLFVFDVWNGLATLQDYSPVRVKRASSGATTVLRVSNTSLDAITQVADVKFDFLVMRRGEPPFEFSERHFVRFFMPRELTDLLEAHGFQVLLKCPFMGPDRGLEPGDWNMTFVARKR